MNRVVLQPADKATLSTLRILRFGRHDTRPFREIHRGGLQQAGDHPGQGLGIPAVVPEAGLELVEDRLAELLGIRGGIHATSLQDLFR